jgi:ABC-type multidrug transport system permease subunit
MKEHLGFLRASSAVVKIAAWIFLFLGIVGGVSITAGLVPGNPRWMGALVLAIYAFFFFLLFLIAKIADLLIKIISLVGGCAPGGNETKKE